MKPRLRAGVIIIHDDSLLIVEHKDKSGFWWTVPGGGVEGAETLFEAAIREAHEEVALDVTPERIIAFRQYISEYYQLNQAEFFIRCSITSSEISKKNLVGKNDEESIQRIQWVKLSELKNYFLLPDILKTLDYNSKEMIFIGSEYDQSE